MRRVLWSAMFALAMVGRADAAANDYFTEFVRDFGVTSRGPVLTHYFAITNTTKATLTIGTARVSCGCVSAGRRDLQRPCDGEWAHRRAFPLARVGSAGIFRRSYGL